MKDIMLNCIQTKWTS